MTYGYNIYDVIDSKWGIPKDILNIINLYVNNKYDEIINLVKKIIKEVKINQKFLDEIYQQQLFKILVKIFLNNCVNYSVLVDAHTYDNFEHKPSNILETFYKSLQICNKLHGSIIEQLYYTHQVVLICQYHFSRFFKGNSSEFKNGNLNFYF